MNQRPPTLFRYLTSALLIFLCFEALAFLTMRVLFRESRVLFTQDRRFHRTQALIDFVEAYKAGEGDVAHHPEFGWVPNPAVPGNAGGARAAQAPPPAPPKGKVRVAAFGDSFTYGQDVTAAEAWPAQLQALLPEAEVLNFGVMYYGVDQMFWRFKEMAPAVKPDVVIMAVTLPAIRKNLSQFIPLGTSRVPYPLTKPRYERTDRELSIIPHPLPDIESYTRLHEKGKAALAAFEHDWFNFFDELAHPLRHLPSYQLVQTARHRHRRGRLVKEATEITLILLRRFRIEAEAAGMRPVILFIPFTGRPDEQGASRAIEREDFPYVNAGNSLMAARGAVMGERVMTKVGNRAIAEAVAGYLTENRMLVRRRDPAR